jgi:nucleoside-diphosphate-sugar epimerase
MIHLATPASAALNNSQPFDMAEICIDGTRRLLELAKQRRVAKFLLASRGASTDAKEFERSFEAAQVRSIPGPPTLREAHGGVDVRHRSEDRTVLFKDSPRLPSWARIWL